MRLILVFCVFGLSMICSPALADLRVGFSEQEVAVPNGISLAGYFQRRLFRNSSSQYSKYFRSSTGKYDIPKVKTLAIDDGAKVSFFVTLEVIAVEPDFKNRVESLLKDKIDRPFEVNLFATHTHSGPGGFVKTGLWQQLATDKYIKEVFESFVSAIETTSLSAYKSLEDAKLSYVKSSLKDAVFNRRNSPFLNPQIHVLKFLSATQSKTIATLLNFPIHGTALGPDNLYVSGDVPALLESNLSQMTDSPVMFISGAAGDVGPKIDMTPNKNTSPLVNPAQPSYDKMNKYGKALSEQIFAIWEKTDIVNTGTIESRIFKIQLPRARANLSLCMQSLLPKNFQWVAKLFFGINLPNELNRPMEVNMIKFSPFTFYLIPGEPIGEIGAQIEKYSLDNKLPNPIIMTLANSYFGYILTEKEFNRGGYETCNSFYGKDYGSSFLNGLFSSMEKFAKIVTK